jgi:hypothetical protein
VRTIADHILDIAFNSVTAGATEIWLDVDHNPASHRFVFSIRDNGRGMDADTQERVFDPFFTTRSQNVRRFGLGLPFLRENTELSGGGVELYSVSGEGTTLKATFHTDSVDCLPFGDLASTMFTLLTSDAGVQWHIRRAEGDLSYAISTEELESVFPSEELSDPQAQLLLLEFLREQEHELLRSASGERE